MYEAQFLTKQIAGIRVSKIPQKIHGQWFVILFVIYERITILVLRLKMCFLYEHFRSMCILKFYGKVVVTIYN